MAVRAQVDLWRWAGVPFLLRTGKRLPSRATEIAIRFKDRPLRRTPTMEVEMDGVGAIATEPNVLVFRIQPNEGISLSFVTKQPGMGFSLQPVQMDFDYEHAFHVGLPEAYERLLLDAIKGIPLLFMRTRRSRRPVGIHHADYRSLAKTTAAEIPELRSRHLGPDRCQPLGRTTSKANGANRKTSTYKPRPLVAPAN